MESSFDTRKYIARLGEQLIFEFQQAGDTTHPHSVGGAREQSAKSKLKNILPNGIGVGSGFVIDSYGNTSSQCDIIIFEEAFAMKYNHSDDEANTYYNCESVIAVGEIKSKISTDQLTDSIKKLVKIKSLKRYNPNGFHYRKYLSATALSDAIGGEKCEYYGNDNSLKQIYTFILCDSLQLKTETVLKHIRQLCSEPYQYPNRILSVKGAFIAYLKKVEEKICSITPGGIDSNAVFNLVDSEYAFNYFISDLTCFILHANTVPLNYQRYTSYALQETDLTEIIDF